MADTTEVTEFDTKRQKTRHGFENARDDQDAAVLEHQVAAEAPEKCPSEFQVQRTRLASATNKMASAATTFSALLTNVESFCGYMIGKLQDDEERYKFLARCGNSCPSRTRMLCTAADGFTL